MSTIIQIQRFLGLAFLLGYTSIYYLVFTVATVGRPPIIDVAYDGYALPMITVPILGTLIAIAFRRFKKHISFPIPSFLGSLVAYCITYFIVLNLLLGPSSAASWIESKGTLKVVVCWLGVFPVCAIAGGWLGVVVAKVISGSYLIHAHKIIQFVLSAIAGFFAFNLILVFAFLITALLIGSNPIVFFTFGTAANFIVIRVIAPQGVWRNGAFCGSALIFVVFFVFNFL